MNRQRLFATLVSVILITCGTTALQACGSGDEDSNTSTAVSADEQTSAQDSTATENSSDANAATDETAYEGNLCDLLPADEVKSMSSSIQDFYGKYELHSTFTKGTPNGYGLPPDPGSLHCDYDKSGTAIVPVLTINYFPDSKIRKDPHFQWQDLDVDGNTAIYQDCCVTGLEKDLQVQLGDAKLDVSIAPGVTPTPQDKADSIAIASQIIDGL